MATTYVGWVADGRPYRDCQPSVDLRDTLGKGHGLIVYTYPDPSHQTAQPPEDHTPYSHTPWPGSQPYPYGRAADIMPNPDVCDWRKLGQQIIDDIDANVPGTECIGYVNYTTPDGRCLNVSYQPSKRVSPSSDTGHIHVSFRTDYVTSHVMAGYDPVARLLGDDMSEMFPKKGDKGEGVKYRQRQLVKLGYKTGTDTTQYDGTYGAAMVAAVKKYRTDRLKPEDVGDGETISGWMAYQLERDLNGADAKPGPKGDPGPVGPAGLQGEPGRDGLGVGDHVVIHGDVVETAP